MDSKVSKADLLKEIKKLQEEVVQLKAGLEGSIDPEKERLKGIIESTSDLVSTSTADGAITSLNKAGYKMLGYADDVDVTAFRIPDFHPEWAFQLIEAEGLKNAIANGIWEGETAILGPGGVEVPVSQVIMAHKSADGTIAYFSTIMRDITERKKNEKALLEEKYFTEAVINSLPGLFYLYSFEDRFYRWNKNFEIVSGYSTKEMGELGVAQIFNGSDLDNVRVAVQNVIRDGVSSVEADLTTKSGEKIPYYFTGRRVKIDGELLLVGLAIDITERKMAEAALRKSESNYRKLFDGSSEAIFIHDPDTGEVLDVNKTMLDMWDVEPSEIKGMTVGDFSYGKSPYAVEDAAVWIHKAVHSGPQVFRWLSKRKNGELFWTEVSVKLIELSGYKRVLAAVRDISERVAAEIAMQQLRRYLHNIIDAMPSVIIGTDAETHVTLWNEKAFLRTSITAEQANGKVLDDLFHFFDEQTSMIKQAVDSKEIKRINKLELRIEDKTIYVSVAVFPLVTDGFEGAVVRIDDITDQVNLEEIVIRSEKMLTVGNLAAGMAHEINNPLAGILQNMQVLKSRVAKDFDKNIEAAKMCGTTMEAVSKFLDERGIYTMIDLVISSGNRAANIVENMLSFCRKGDVSFEPYDLAELMDKTIALVENDYDLKRKYDFRQIKIVREYQVQRPLVRCEGGKIQQVFLNILKNGAQAMSVCKEGAPDKDFCFYVRINAIGDMAQIEIEDNGPGMEEDILNRIFEPFYTTKSVGVGTGLGLSVSYFIITENHQGEMIVESVPGKGTKFIIRIPFKEKSTYE